MKPECTPPRDTCRGGGFPFKHEQTEPSDSRLPPGAGALWWASHSTQTQLLHFSMTGNPSTGIFCWGLFQMPPKENEIDLDPFGLARELGAEIFAISYSVPEGHSSFSHRK